MLRVLAAGHGECQAAEQDECVRTERDRPEGDEPAGEPTEKIEQKRRRTAVFVRAQALTSRGVEDEGHREDAKDERRDEDRELAYRA